MFFLLLAAEGKCPPSDASPLLKVLFGPHLTLGGSVLPVGVLKCFWM